MTLEQFHTHAPSEHSIGGIFADGELHMVHKKYADDGKTLVSAAVLGVMLVVDPNLKSSPFTPLWSYVDQAAKVTRWGGDKTYDSSTRYSAEWKVTGADTPVDVYKSFLPDDKTFFHYIGSLTTYPCTNGINWFLFETPIFITTADLENIKAAVKKQKHTLTSTELYHSNADNRPIQPQVGSFHVVIIFLTYTTPIPFFHVYAFVCREPERYGNLKTFHSAIVRSSLVPGLPTV